MNLWTVEGLQIRRWSGTAELAKEYGLNPKTLANQIGAKSSFSSSIICGGVTVYTEDPHGDPKPAIVMQRIKGTSLMPTLCTHGLGVWRDIPNPGEL